MKKISYFAPFLGLILLLPIFVMLFVDIFALEVSGLISVALGIFPDFNGVVEGGNIPIIINGIFIVVTAVLTLVLIALYVLKFTLKKKYIKNITPVIKIVTYCLIASAIILFASGVIALFVNELIVGLAYYRLIPIAGFYLQIPVLLGSVAMLLLSFKK